MRKATAAAVGRAANGRDAAPATPAPANAKPSDDLAKPPPPQRIDAVPCTSQDIFPSTRVWPRPRPRCRSQTATIPHLHRAPAPSAASPPSHRPNPRRRHRPVLPRPVVGNRLCRHSFNLRTSPCLISIGRRHAEVATRSCSQRRATAKGAAYLSDDCCLADASVGSGLQQPTDRLAAPTPTHLIVSSLHHVNQKGKARLEKKYERTLGMFQTISMYQGKRRKEELSQQSGRS